MSIFDYRSEKRRSLDNMELMEDEHLLEDMPRSDSPKGHLESEKRLRREIANSNERRRMQSINAGFQSLKTLIPHSNGEKLSKAAILQTTTDYINDLERDKTRLLSQNSQLKQMLHEVPRGDFSDVSSQGSPPPKRKKRDTESSDEGISMAQGGLAELAEEPNTDTLKREMIELRTQLDRERRLRLMLEKQTRELESKVYPERLRCIASQVQAQMKFQEGKMRYEDLRRYQEDSVDLAPPRPASQPPAQTPLSHSPPQAAFLNNNLSQKNLETIVEAILYVEGYDRKPDSKDCRVPHSEESEKESEGSDMDDCKSESSSGRDSPCCRTEMCSSLDTTTTTASTIKQEGHLLGSPERYPNAITHFLQHQAAAAAAAAAAAVPRPFVSRPGVIVQKSS